MGERMELSRREFLVLAAGVPLAASIPALVLAEEKKPVVDPFANDELPLSGLAGECSGWR